METIVASHLRAPTFVKLSGHSPTADRSTLACHCICSSASRHNQRTLKAKRNLDRFQNLQTCICKRANFAGFGVAFGPEGSKPCGRKGGRRDRSCQGNAVRAGTSVDEPIFEDGDLYEAPDAYGGWKGIRKSALTAEWEQKGKLVTVAGYDWFVVDEEPVTGPPKSTVLLVPGLPAHSYSFREVIRLLSEAGHRAVSFDWPGFGLSDKPSPKAFGYRPADFAAGLGALVATLGLEKMTLVAQGFLGGSVGIQYAAANPEHVDKLVILNAPLREDCRLPKPFQQMTLPFIGAAFAQDPTRLADLTFNSSGPYEMSEDDLQVYRQPFMESSDAGFAALAAVKNLDLKGDVARCRAALTSESFRTPTLLTLGSQDKWLSEPSDLIASLKGRPWFSTTVLDGAGHFGQEDWPEKVAAAIRRL